MALEASNHDARPNPRNVSQNDVSRYGETFGKMGPGMLNRRPREKWCPWHRFSSKSKLGAPMSGQTSQRPSLRASGLSLATPRSTSKRDGPELTPDGAEGSMWLQRCPSPDVVGEKGDEKGRPETYLPKAPLWSRPGSAEMRAPARIRKFGPGPAEVRARICRKWSLNLRKLGPGSAEIKAQICGHSEAQGGFVAGSAEGALCVVGGVAG